jgi:hypothetical protein
VFYVFLLNEVIGDAELKRGKEGKKRKKKGDTTF